MQITETQRGSRGTDMEQRRGSGSEHCSDLYKRVSAMEGSRENGFGKGNWKERVNFFWRGSGFRGDRTDVRMAAKALLILLVLALVFYDTPLAMVPLLPLARPICRRSREREEERRRGELVLEFKECTAAVLTSMKSGSSAENAFRNAGEEMAFSYGEESAICIEMGLIARGLDSNVPLENLLSDLADRSGAEEIRDFAEVFAIAKRSGGNMTEIMNRTITQIQNRIDVEREISVMMSSSRLEQQIMDVVPIGIIAYMRVTSEGFMDVLYGNPAGVVIMSVCLAVYGAAFVLSEKITAIRV